MTFVFLFEDGESPGARIARCCEQVLADGPMGDKQRPADYRAFIGCGYEPAIPGGGDLGVIETSCAIFVRAVLHWCGRPARPVRIGQGIYQWIQLTPSHAAWTYAEDGEPEPGAVFYRAYSRHSRGVEGHVGVCVRREGDLWVTAEGGGGDGTTCRLGGPKDLRRRDSLGRVLVGWWRPEAIGLSDEMPATYAAEEQ